MTSLSDHALRGQKALWLLETPIPAEVREQLPGLSVMVSHLLYCRGVRTPESIQAFFSGNVISHDPWLMPDMGAAVDRIARAAADQERIAVYGDFDCDGITAAAILVEALQALRLDPIVHIPERADGHGLQPEGLAALADQGVTLIVTADCGIGAIEEVRVAHGMGMDVIVTDHHQARLDGTLPPCPTVSPTRHDSEYPFPYLCGAGVVYKLVQALAERVPGAADPAGMLDLVALGTVADVVPLQDENRSLVIQGLARLRATTRIGLLALFAAADVDASRIDPISVGFYLAPRINAANRLASPRLAYDLITASDRDRASQLARQLSRLNRERQVLVADRLEKVIGQIGDPAALTAAIESGGRSPILTVIGDWPTGISGLLAGRLAEMYGLPVFVGADAGDGIISVSARGVPGAGIDILLEACEGSVSGGLFLGYGGHSGAGGFRVAAGRMEEARATLEEQARIHFVSGEVGARMSIDAEVTLRQLDLPAAQQIRALAPFGMGFPEPLFLARDVTVKRVNVLSGGKHVRLSLRQGQVERDAVCFNCAPELTTVKPNSKLDLVFHLQLNEWRGLVKPELRLRDWRVAE